MRRLIDVMLHEGGMLSLDENMLLLPTALSGIAMRGCMGRVTLHADEDHHWLVIEIDAQQVTAPPRKPDPMYRPRRRVRRYRLVQPASTRKVRGND